MYGSSRWIRRFEDEVEESFEGNSCEVHTLKQFSSILPHDVEARRTFVRNGGLQFLQELNETVGGKLTEFIQRINSCYPPEIVEYYSPNYSRKLLAKIEDLEPTS
mmetsp:Transcript_17957/g.56310  ORF Transcript_17957/g.56310 Transcript_17957/m.56310 type:complete len:105 (-) Transcript_17957:726-1040(-)